MKNLLVIALVAILPACKSSKASPKGESKKVEAAPALELAECIITPHE